MAGEVAASALLLLRARSRSRIPAVQLEASAVLHPTVVQNALQIQDLPIQWVGRWKYQRQRIDWKSLIHWVPIDVADEELTALFGPPYVSQVAGDHQSIVFFQAVSDFCYGACRAADYLENSRC